MRADRRALLESLMELGEAHDAATPDRLDRYRNAGAETGEFLHMLVCVVRPDSILEIGTSNGYSTIWLADAAESVGAVVHSVDDHERQSEAVDNLARAGVADETVQLHRGRAQDLVSSLGVHDIVFLDAERTEYPSLWPSLAPVIGSDGLLVVDNALSHQAEMEPFADLLRSPSGNWVSWVVPVGSGQLVAQRGRAR